MEKTAYRSKRKKPVPKKTPKGKTYNPDFTSRDVDLFRILQTYKYLPLNFIYDLLPEQGLWGLDRHGKKNTRGNYVDFRKRCSELCHLGVLIWPKQQENLPNDRYRKDIYSLGKKGRDHLAILDEARRTYIGRGSNFRHELETCQTIASLEILAPKYDVTFHHWNDLQGRLTISQRAFDTPNPFNLKIAQNEFVIPDGAPFALQKGNKIIFTVGVEYDRGTETQNGASTVSIKKKLERYAAVYAQDILQKQLGFPKDVAFFVPFFCPLPARVPNMTATAENVSSSGIGWATFCEVSEFNGRLTPEPIDLYTREWLRAKRPSIVLAEIFK